MISASLLRFLPHAALALAIIGAIAWIDHLGYRRAMTDRDARDAVLLNRIRADLRQSEERLAASIDGVGGSYERQRQALSHAGLALHPIIATEATHDPRLSDPAAGLTPGLLEALNRARAAGACATAASGRIECALPAPAAGPWQGDR